MPLLTFKTLIITAADDICCIWLNKIRLGILCDLSVKQTIHIKGQALFSLKNYRRLQLCIAL